MPLYYSLKDAFDGIEHLSRSTVASESDLCSLVLQNHARVKGADEMALPISHRLPGLRASLQSLRDEHGIPIQDLIPRILQHAQKLHRVFPDGRIATLPRGQAKSVSLTAAQISCLLANSALCNLGRIPLPKLTVEQKQALRETIPQYGSLSPHLWYQSGSRVARERITALLLYLHAVTDPTQERYYATRIITFRRATKSHTLSWTTHDSVYGHVAKQISVEFIHKQGIEAVKILPTTSHARMDFANATLHVGALWPTATQEEILFSAYPECLVGVLFCETMADTDAIIISNVNRFIESEGFAEMYRVKGLVSHAEGTVCENETTCIVAVDAAIPETLREQLQQPLLNRDVGKAATAWAASGKRVIVTGNWGSGAFGGNIYAKFLHQYLAACRSSIAQAGETIQLKYCLISESEAIEQNIRRLKEWACAVYTEGGESAVMERLEALARDGEDQDDWSLEGRLLQLSASEV